MRVFLTGASGWIGSMIARDLLAAGHSVTGLTSKPGKAEALGAAGVTPLVGTLQDTHVLRRGAEDAEGIIHTAFGLDISRIADLAAEDAAAIETFGEVFAGSSRPIVVTSGFLNVTGGKTLEDERPEVLPDFPRASEQTAFALAGRGVHASVVRNPRSVHGQGEKHGFVPMLAAVARDKGVSAYIGEGQQMWPAVHRLDAARLYRLALERGARGEAYHAVAEEGVPFRDIADAIGRQLGLPAVSLTPEEAEAHFGPLAIWVANHGPASNAWTRETLGWHPEQPGIVEDVEQPGYLG
ncbi:SDR family oxidoreductase [Pseudoroseicyclus aestuarii]|uniref:Nucleoside-diphosphate-sugar epimerase n=1 Tax=Pseudoroseicyclus aestuarii TaxID=1795041 RepID=A0A318SZL4_9RHOB|nr:SDR family oxidoreductase [Pseudoroseicyclus aestuarii]PYE85866.1 nucleoside-diphosphate-sugar epimerase [Pseudoroseicyclus aestuarii]